MNKLLSIPILFLLFISACSTIPLDIENGVGNSEFISSIDIITVTNTTIDKNLDTEIFFDIFYSDKVSGTLVSVLGDSEKISSSYNTDNGRTKRFSFKPQLDNIKIGQIEKFSITNKGSDELRYNCIVVIINKKRVLFSTDGIDEILDKGNSYTVDRDPLKSEHLQIETVHNPSAIREGITTPQNISVITTTAEIRSAGTDDNIYIKFVADSSLSHLALPDYTCEATANEYQLATSDGSFKDGQSNYFTLPSKLVPTSFTKTQFIYRAESTEDADDWCFSSILVLAGGTVIYYKDFASDPVTSNNKIKNYRCLGENGGKIWIDKFPEPINEVNGFSIAILPDTQGYTVRGNQDEFHTNNSDLGFYRQIEWIVDNMYTRNIKYVAHMGDLIEGYGRDLGKWDLDAYAKQWKCAEGALNVLSEVGIPFGFLPGNHDEDSSINPFQDSYKDYFPIENYSNRPGFIGNLDGMTSNAWEVQIRDKRYLFINVEDLGSPVGIFNNRDRINIQNWVKSILPDYRGSNDRVILSTHSFVKTDGSFYERAHSFLEDVFTDTVNGVQVKNNNRVDLILCGHFDGVVYVPGSNFTLKSGITISYPPVILSNFQGEYEDNFKQTTYGNGWIRTLTIPYNKNADALISTFSVLKYNNHTMGSDQIKLGWVPESKKNITHNYENFGFVFP